MAPQRGEHRGSKVTDVYPGVADVYRNGLLHMFLVGLNGLTGEDNVSRSRCCNRDPDLDLGVGLRDDRGFD